MDKLRFGKLIEEYNSLHTESNELISKYQESYEKNKEIIREYREKFKIAGMDYSYIDQDYKVQIPKEFSDIIYDCYLVFVRSRGTIYIVPKICYKAFEIDHNKGCYWIDHSQLYNVDLIIDKNNKFEIPEQFHYYYRPNTKMQFSGWGYYIEISDNIY